MSWHLHIWETLKNWNCVFLCYPILDFGKHQFSISMVFRLFCWLGREYPKTGRLHFQDDVWIMNHHSVLATNKTRSDCSVIFWFSFRFIHRKSSVCLSPFKFAQNALSQTLPLNDSPALWSSLLHPPRDTTMTLPLWLKTKDPPLDFTRIGQVNTLISDHFILHSSLMEAVIYFELPQL